MDFLLWATGSVHLFCVVVWLGGLAYQAVVTLPVARATNSELAGSHRHLIRRFLPFVWMCVWSILITGVVLMLFNPRFVFFQYNDPWSVLLGMKQAVFLLMCFFSFGYARMFSRTDELLSRKSGGEEALRSAQPYYHSMLRYGKINLGLGIVALLVASGMK